MRSLCMLLWLNNGVIMLVIKNEQLGYFVSY